MAKQKVFAIESDDVINGLADNLGDATLKGRKPIYVYHDEPTEKLFVSRTPITKKLVAPLIADAEEDEEHEIDDDED